MTSNFDFLKNIDKELFDAVEDAQKLFCDKYFNQSIITLRIFAEKMAKKVLGSQSADLTFDDILHCLKDKIKTEREHEFIEDLFFIKKQGNSCAHGEDITSSDALECFRRAFEAAINYAYSKKKDEKIDKLQFDTTLLITGQKLEETPLVEQYVKLAQQEKESMLNNKQGEFLQTVQKERVDLDEEYPQEQKPSKSRKKQLTPVQEKVKAKVKEAKQNLKQNINKTPEKPKKSSKKSKSERKKSKKKKSNLKKAVLFLIFVTISLFFLTKMLFFF